MDDAACDSPFSGIAGGERGPYPGRDTAFVRACGENGEGLVGRFLRVTHYGVDLAVADVQAYGAYCDELPPDIREVACPSRPVIIRLIK